MHMSRVRNVRYYLLAHQRTHSNKYENCHSLPKRLTNEHSFVIISKSADFPKCTNVYSIRRKRGNHASTV